MGDGEYPDFYCETIRKARKNHTCIECKNTILKKESYFFISGKWGRYISSYHRHLKCHELFYELMSKLCIESCPIGDLKEMQDFFKPRGVNL